MLPWVAVGNVTVDISRNFVISVTTVLGFSSFRKSREKDLFFL